ncbi:MAG: pyridoxamine 5'-phosphate oxidase family protein [Mycolicibacterium neoaurum]|uniref:Pyridoxamine 5'-phosphate oxidase-like protein n=1 Tax=Mycolicibacterium neoaurum TaxID=1795 RepID=A0AAV2WM78_MYCNE|nr:pyridoxamine 5'-phosphate oxidase family protein [Mycolicibacterium neoaurum]TLH57308.1 pyridoxamine 5'-phosphate oxidase [Mycolicibacterium neoaurum]CDQ45299.1 pyridoxamine 5'-phosphate oxidase-like protein [Mycolicibacterium neoaurum]
MPLAREEREAFLAEPHVAALSIAAGPHRGPLTLPIWYQYIPGGQPWFLTGAGSRKHKLIEAAGHLSLMVDRVEPTVRYVSVDGAVARIDDATDDQLVEMARRYLPAAAVEPYLAVARREHGPSVAVYLRPQHWFSADMGAF